MAKEGCGKALEHRKEAFQIKSVLERDQAQGKQHEV